MYFLSLAGGFCLVALCNFILCLFLSLFLSLDPLTVYGEGNYGLASVKEIRVNNDFLGLDQDTINCQTETTINNCTTEAYLRALLAHCSCLPLSLRPGYTGGDVSQNDN